MADPESSDVFDLVPPNREIRQLERIYAMSDNPLPSERLRATLPTGLRHAESLRERIAALRRIEIECLRCNGRLPREYSLLGGRPCPSCGNEYGRYVERER